MFDFTGKTALVTGAGSGIGREAARYYRACGATIVLADIDGRTAAAGGAEIDPSGEATCVCSYDASIADSAEATVARAVARFGKIDFLVLAAGIYEHQIVSEMTDDQWNRTIAVNLNGAFYIVRRAVPHMPEGSAIVTIASVAAHHGGAFAHTHYGASKGGLLAVTRGLARDLAPAIRANTVAPGWIDTPMVAQALADLGPSVVSSIPLRRIGKPREVASIVAFLCSDAASFVTGETTIAAGGAYMG